MKTGSTSHLLNHLYQSKTIDDLFVQNFLKAWVSFTHHPIYDYDSGVLKPVRDWDYTQLSNYFLAEEFDFINKAILSLGFNEQEAPAFLFERFKFIALPLLSPEQLTMIHKIKVQSFKKFNERKKKEELLEPPEKRKRTQITESDTILLDYFIEDDKVFTCDEPTSMDSLFIQEEEDGSFSIPTTYDLLESLKTDKSIDYDFVPSPFQTSHDSMMEEMFDCADVIDDPKLVSESAKDDSKLKFTRYCSIITLFKKNGVKTTRSIVNLMPKIAHEASLLLNDFVLGNRLAYPLLVEKDVWYLFMNLFYTGKVPKYDNSRGQKVLATAMFERPEVSTNLRHLYDQEKALTAETTELLQKIPNLAGEALMSAHARIHEINSELAELTSNRETWLLEREYTKTLWIEFFNLWLHDKDYQWVHEKYKDHLKPLSLATVIAARCDQLKGNFKTCLPRIVLAWLKNFVNAQCRWLTLPDEVASKFISYLSKTDTSVFELIDIDEVLLDILKLKDEEVEALSDEDTFNIVMNCVSSNFDYFLQYCLFYPKDEIELMSQLEKDLLDHTLNMFTTVMNNYPVSKRLIQSSTYSDYSYNELLEVYDFIQHLISRMPPDPTLW
ncbi:hypothetical protein RCL1_003242 [Eukaryota sp. TZLM3-RCL]